MGFRNTLDHFRNYFGATIATKALTIISVPVLTRWLGVSPTDYGMISLFSTYVGIFVCVFTLNTYIGVGRYYYEDRNDFNAFLGTTINLNILMLLITSVIALLFVIPISAYLDITPLLYVLMIPTIVFMISSAIFVQVFSAKQESAKIARYSIATAYVGFGLIVIFTILNPNDKYLGSIYSQVVTGGLFLFYIIWQLRPYYIFAFRKEHIKYMLKYSIPLIPYFLSSIILGQFGRVMIANYSNLEDAGLYSFAYNIGMLLALFFSSVNSAWVPKFYPLMKEKNYVEYDRQVNYIHRFTLCFALGLIYFGGELGRLLGSKSFHSSLSIVPIVVLGYLFFAYFYFWQWNIDYAKKTIYSSLVVGAAGVINIVLNMFFLPRYGYMAAAYTTMVSYLCMAIFAWAVNKFILKIYAVKVRSLYKLFFIFLIFMSFFYSIKEISNLWIEIVLKMLLVILFISFCFKAQIKAFYNNVSIS